MAALEGVLASLTLVGLAELGDKTQLAVILLASNTKSRLRLLLGVMAGFLLVDGAAVLFGAWMTTVLPENILKAAASLLFILFGLLILRGRGEEGTGASLRRNTFLSGFALISLTEWGDKTQLTAALLATRYEPTAVLAGSLLGLGVLSAAAVYLGGWVSEKVDRNTVSNAGGILFILTGVLTLLI